MSGQILGNITKRHYEQYVPKGYYKNVSYRKDMLKLAASDPSAAAQIKTLCSEDPLFYVNTFCTTYSPKDSLSGYPITPFVTYEFQDDAILEILECINRGQDVATPKSRDMGASWMCLTAIEWCWHFRDFLSFLMVSRIEDLVDKRGDPDALFWKIDLTHKYQPKWLLPTGRWLGDDDPNRKTLHLKNADNGSVIDGQSTTGNVGVGGRRTAMMLDEFAAFDRDAGYAVLTGTRDVTNCRIFNSTPRGQNAFHDVVKKTSAHVMYLHWSKHPLKNKGLYESDVKTGEITKFDNFNGVVNLIDEETLKLKSVLYPDQYPFVKDGKLRSPWYDFQCKRCASKQEIAQELDIDFKGSDYQFFDPSFIEMLIKKNCRSPLLVGDLEYDPMTLEPKRFNENPKGKMLLWLTLEDGRPSRDRKFVLGSDVSAGTGASNSVSSVVEVSTGEKVGVWRDSHTLPTQFAELTIALGKWLNNAFMIWDRSGPTGEVFTKTIISKGYGNLYRRRAENKIGRPMMNDPGYFLNPQAKNALFEDYRAALSNQKFINRSEDGMRECLEFIRKADGGSIEHSASANAQDPAGARTAHGDEVVADALACIGVMERQENKHPLEPEIPIGSLAWRMEQRKNREMVLAHDGLGKEW